MSKKPTPKYEIVIEYHLQHGDLWITVASPEARQWILDETAQFGLLFEDSDTHRFKIWPRKTYDLLEVAKYLCGDNGLLINRADQSSIGVPIDRKGRHNRE